MMIGLVFTLNKSQKQIQFQLKNKRIKNNRLNTSKLYHKQIPTNRRLSHQSHKLQ